MDLETENRIAAILMKEASELRRQAEKEGVHVYLREPKVRGRPNSRFLTATVLGVQQANRAVEVNEMWRVRQKELELDDRLKGRSREEGSSRDCSNSSSHRDCSNSSRSTNKRHAGDLCSSSKRVLEDSSYPREEGEGLRDAEVEEFLNSRVKRGRGAVGSRMDEAGPYLPHSSDKITSPGREEWEQRVVLGPEKPSSLKSSKSSEDEFLWDKRKEKAHSGGSKKQHCRKHGSKDRHRDKKKRRKSDKRSKHHK